MLISGGKRPRAVIAVSNQAPNATAEEADVARPTGEYPMWVAKQMGHSDLTMIARVYGRWMPSAEGDSGSKAVSLWARKEEKGIMRPSSQADG